MTLETFAAQVEAEENAERRAAEASIKVLHGVRQGRKEFEAEEKAARVPLDAFFRTHPDEKELIDPEAGLRAFLRSGGESTTYDLPSAIQARNPHLYDRLEELGLFVLDGDRVKKAIADGLLLPGDISPWMHKSERTASLLTEELKGRSE